MNKKEEDEYILATCRECGNKGLQKKVANYNQQIVDYYDEDGNPLICSENNWFLMECPTCKSISLFKRYGADYMVDNNGNEFYYEDIVFPPEKRFNHTPRDILKSYEAAVRVARLTPSISLVAIRIVLEKICKERGTTRVKLASMLKQMVEKHILPETLDKCSFIIRKMGNSGAHGDDIAVTTSDVLELLSFIENIMYYIYELPAKIEELNRKFDLNMEGPEDDE